MIRFVAGIGAGLLMATAAFAGMPSSYGAVSFDEALANASRDGRPIMIYFGEDW